MSTLILCTVTVQAQTLAERINAGNVTLVDVRTPKEYAAGTAEGAINIPLEEMGARWQELKGKENMLINDAKAFKNNKTIINYYLSY